MMRFWCQASRSCAARVSVIGSLRSTPRISAPKAGDNGLVCKAGDDDLISKAGDKYAIAFAPIRSLHQGRTGRLPRASTGLATNYTRRNAIDPIGIVTLRNRTGARSNASETSWHMQYWADPQR